MRILNNISEMIKTAKPLEMVYLNKRYLFKFNSTPQRQEHRVHPTS